MQYVNARALGRVLSRAAATFSRARGTRDNAVVPGEFSPAILAHHDPAQLLVAGAEHADALASFAT